MADPGQPAARQCLTIAGLSVEIHCRDVSLINRLTRRYQDFCSTGAADFSVRLEFLQEESQLNLHDLPLNFQHGGLTFDRLGCQGWIDPHGRQAALVMSSTQPLAQAEYFLRLVYALLAYAAGGLLLHAAAVVKGERACVFIGRSGSGKSTVARLARGNRVLNDDMLIFNSRIKALDRPRYSILESACFLSGDHPGGVRRDFQPGSGPARLPGSPRGCLGSRGDARMFAGCERGSAAIGAVNPALPGCSGADPMLSLAFSPRTFFLVAGFRRNGTQH